MKINNTAFGGFVVSENIIKGYPVRYSFREKSEIKELNGWTLYSSEDDDEFVSDSRNFKILNAESVYKFAPVMLEIFDAPYGTDLCWLYEAGVHTGFYDLKDDRETTIEEILQKQI
jgi:hypothetical protein